MPKGGIGSRKPFSFQVSLRLMLLAFACKLSKSCVNKNASQETGLIIQYLLGIKQGPKGCRPPISAVVKREKEKSKKRKNDGQKDTWAWRSRHFRVFFYSENVRTGVDL